MADLWDHFSDPEYLQIENEALKEQYYTLLSDSAELRRLGGMSREARDAMRRDFERELAERQNRVDEVSAHIDRAEQHFARKQAQLDRDIRAAIEDYERLKENAKNKEEEIEILKKVSWQLSERIARTVVAEQKAEAKRQFWPNTILTAFISFVIGLFTSYAYDWLKPILFHKG